MGEIMVDYFVTNTDGGANLRDAPDSGAIKRNLPFGTALTSIPGSTGKWKSVETDKGEKGYVSDKNVTVPASDAVVRLIQSAAHYWEAFAFGKGKEDTSPYYDLVVEIWKELGQGMPPFKRDKKGEVLKDENGNDIYNTSHPDWPWSAAGMSAFIRRAKGYKNFQFSRLHATYIHDSIVARKAKNPAAPFWGYQLNEEAVGVGDLVCQWRGTQQDYKSAGQSAGFTSHTDVICDIKSGYLYAIGANVESDTVGRKKYTINSTGHLTGPSGGSFKSDNTVFMLMRNMVA
ncbi:DUF2272 domain-containing protein (plasmid) [Rhizobium ruizarguesonis]|nr:DUF2272 domain-containing protein [Rhizobium ruizarguesonis]TAZ92274.1 DUF2272 domain-containing protein [Rhizobium ruizarguesonis]